MHISISMHTVNIIPALPVWPEGLLTRWVPYDGFKPPLKSHYSRFPLGHDTSHTRVLFTLTGSGYYCDKRVLQKIETCFARGLHTTCRLCGPSWVQWRPCRRHRGREKLLVLWPIPVLLTCGHMFDNFFLKAWCFTYFLVGAGAMEPCRATKRWSKRSRSVRSIAWWQVVTNRPWPEHENLELRPRQTTKLRRALLV